MKSKTFSHPNACPYCHSERLAVDGMDCAFRCYTRISFAQRKPHAKRTLKCIAIENAKAKAA